MSRKIPIARFTVSVDSHPQNFWVLMEPNGTHLLMQRLNLPYSSYLRQQMSDHDVILTLLGKPHPKDRGGKNDAESFQQWIADRA
jgi:hypothetical protein